MHDTVPSNSTREAISDNGAEQTLGRIALSDPLRGVSLVRPGDRLVWVCSVVTGETGSLEIRGCSCGLATGLQQEPTRVIPPSLISPRKSRPGEGQVSMCHGGPLPARNHPCFAWPALGGPMPLGLLWYFYPNHRRIAADGGASNVFCVTLPALMAGFPCPLPHPSHPLPLDRCAGGKDEEERLSMADWGGLIRSRLDSKT